MGSLTTILASYLRRTNSFVRFLLVGAFNTLIGLSCMLFLLNIAGMSYWFSTFFGNCAGASVSYFLNRSFTFQSKACMKTSVPRFMLVIIVCYFFSYSISYIASNLFADLKLLESSILAENFAVILGTGFYTIMNYIGQRYFVFKKMELI